MKLCSLVIALQVVEDALRHRLAHRRPGSGQRACRDRHLPARCPARRRDLDSRAWPGLSRTLHPAGHPRPRTCIQHTRAAVVRSEPKVLTSVPDTIIAAACAEARTAADDATLAAGTVSAASR